MRLVGGLRALINVFKRFVSLEQPDNQDFCIMEHVVNTIASSIAGHGKLYLGRFCLSKQVKVFKFTRNLEKRQVGVKGAVSRNVSKFKLRKLPPSEMKY